MKQKSFLLVGKAWESCIPEKSPEAAQKIQGTLNDQVATALEYKRPWMSLLLQEIIFPLLY